MDQEVIKITVKGNTMGMVGLGEIFLRAKDLKGLSEIEVEKFLLEEAKKKNYIPIVRRKKATGVLPQSIAERSPR